MSRFSFPEFATPSRRVDMGRGHGLVVHARSIIACALLIPLLTACATNPQEGSEPRMSAKRGWVVEDYVPASHGADLPPCIAALSKADLQARRFVTIEYRRARQMYSTVAELPETLSVQPHDEVDYRPADCSQGRLPLVVSDVTSLDRARHEGHLPDR